MYMSDILKTLLSGQNQFASGGLLLMIVGSVVAYLRALPQRCWVWLVSQTTMTITVKDEDTAFVWVKEWLLEQRFLKRIRHVDLDTTLRGTTLALIPAPGRHWFWYAGRPFWVWFYRSENTHARSLRRIESLTFTTIGRNQKFLQHFVAEVVACHRKKMQAISNLYVFDDGWSRVEAYRPRSLDSVILKPGEKEHLIQDIERFRASRQRYRDVGVPYHRGYLFYGPPGTGKTSIVSALAAKFGLSVYVINLTEFADRSLKTAVNDVMEHSLILFEDIDCMRAGNVKPRGDETESAGKPDEKRDAADRFGVTLSGLLNVLDGFGAPDNVLFVMTTNKVEALDPALLRPGRIDYKLFLGKAAESQKIELYRKFFPQASFAEAREFVQRNDFAETMAEFQGLLLALEQGDEGIERELSSSVLVAN
jgi:chaperone BCS1